MRYRDSCLHHGNLFFVRINGSLSGSDARNGIFRCPHDFVHYRDGRNQNCLDIRTFPAPQDAFLPVYLLPGVMAPFHSHAGNLPLFRQEKSISC